MSSLGLQRDQRICCRRTARRQIARNDGHDCHDERDRRQRRGIRCLDAVERPEHTKNRDRSSDADCETDTDDRQTLPEHKTEQARRVRAERRTDADLARPLDNAVAITPLRPSPVSTTAAKRRQ